ncbi:MAG: VWA domain-containing protein [Rubellimicrobium sp.]|nr:VWA domain-containing protein [Rubellimicrobium sp.]
MRFAAALLAATLLFPFSIAQAQERANTILVFDASGSMWGQIDGVNKIVIARDVVAEILRDFPEDQNLGLTVYGHNRRGDCGDIETLVEPGTGNRDEIARIVNTLNPRGMTPMADSIIAAANALRHTENAATVILVSDGIETCNPDPCAVARTLAETGVDFTAHVVGFDLEKEPGAVEQLQCMADATGGLFFSTSNASELSDALSRVVQAVAEPEPAALIPVTLRAVVGSADGPLVEGPVLWTVADEEGYAAVDDEANPLLLELYEGSHVVGAYAVVREDEVNDSFILSGTEAVTVTLIFPEPEPEPEPEPQAEGVTFIVTDEVTRQPVEMPVTWTILPEGGGEGFTLTGSEVVELIPRGVWEVTVTRDADGASASTPMVQMSGEQTIALTLPPFQAAADIVAQSSAPMGATIPVGWEGPGDNRDFIGIGLPGERYGNYAWIRDGNPVQLRLPVEPGDYELRYYGQPGNLILATRSITITEVEAALDFAQQATAGETLPVTWDGPGYRDDFIGVSIEGERYTNYAWTRDGSPAQLRMPTEPGDYVISYYLGQGNVPLVSRPVTVSEVAATLDFAEQAMAGETLSVTWEGPGYRDDFIGVSIEGERYTNYAWTRDGSPAQLRMPTEPGDYVISYYLGQGNVAIASRPVTVSEVAATLEAQDTALVGETVPVTWTGPGYRDDFIGVSVEGERYTNYSWTRDGSPAQLRMPAQPGDYVITYYLGQGNVPIASRTIRVVAAEVALTAPEVAEIGSTVVVDWIGPGNRDDFIGISKPGERYTTYRWTRDGSPAQLRMPAEPGDYVITYYLGQDNTPLASIPIRLEEIAVSVTAPAEAAAGSLISVGWNGPNAEGDFIAVGRPGEAYGNWNMVSDGNPLRLLMPIEPGDYEIRYYFGDGEQVLAASAIRVIPVTARLIAPGTGSAGGEVQVGWEGPGYEYDFIGIAPAGEAGYSNWAYVSNGNPVTLTLPDAPGSYDIRYFLGQGEVPLGDAVRIELEAAAED